MPASPLFTGKEHIIRGAKSAHATRISVGVELRMMASAECGAEAFSTALVTLTPGASVPLHRHPIGEAITVIEGEALLRVEGRRYRMTALDSVFLPAGTAHSVHNSELGRDLLVHSAFGSAFPSRELVAKEYREEDRELESPRARDPEKLVRFAQAPAYDLAPNAFFTDLYARRMGSVGICGGYGRFAAGASLPCHMHDFDESITIVKGTARCLVQGRKHVLSNCATAYIPAGMPHRFINADDDEMAMIWVYAGAEPDRRLVDSGYCAGTMAWPGPFLVR